MADTSTPFDARPAEDVQVFVAFDHNMPRMEECHLPECATHKHIQCRHRFEMEHRVFYFNRKPYHGYSDLRVVTTLCEHVLRAADQTSFRSDCLFVIVTKDQDFIADVQRDWRKTEGSLRTTAQVFCARNWIDISWSGVDMRIHIAVVNARSNGGGRDEDLKGAVHLVRKLVATQLEL